MKRIVVAGGTGFIGSHLVNALVERGDKVSVLTRDASKRRGLPDPVELVEWNPLHDGEWQAVFDGKDAVVQLAGEPLVGTRHTEAVKKRLYDSRVTSTECMVRGMAQAGSKPSVFVCGSAIGYYGNQHGAEPLDENSAPGADFPAQLCVAWEAAAAEAGASGIRVVFARTGIVLGSGGGVLEQMSLPFKLFVGGPIGSGEQMVSWIHMDDMVAILLKCIDDQDVKGPVNLTAPEPVSNAELARAIGAALGRPSYLRVPGFALKVLFGEGAEPILGGQRVLPKAMLEQGYPFRFRDVTAAVKQAL